MKKILTEETSRGRINITKNEKNHATNTEIVVMILWVIQFPYRCRRSEDNVNVIRICMVNGHDAIINESILIFNYN